VLPQRSHLDHLLIGRGRLVFPRAGDRPACIKYLEPWVGEWRELIGAVTASRHQGKLPYPCIT